MTEALKFPQSWSKLVIRKASHHHGRGKKTSPTSLKKKPTCKPDILISIKPAYMDQIVSRTKNHEFRSYLIPKTVQRMWLYVSSPQQVLKYVAVISHGKSPGEIEAEDGLGNADFNAGLQGPSAYAYEIRELYQLQQPLPLTEIQQTYGVTFPQRYVYVPESMAQDIEFEKQTRLF